MIITTIYFNDSVCHSSHTFQINLFVPIEYTKGKNVLYFTYGSNMDIVDLKSWCDKKAYTLSEFNYIGSGYIQGYELTFNYYSIGRKGGAANIMEKKGSYTYGLLFSIDVATLTVLRKKEGYPKYYGEITIPVVQGECILKDVVTYKVVSERELPIHQKPTRYYLDLIISNARKNNFPDEYITFLGQFETQGL